MPTNEEIAAATRSLKFDETDPFEVALEREIRELEWSNDSWQNDKNFPPNTAKAAMLCNEAEMEGIRFALFKYRSVKVNGYRIRADPQEDLMAATKSIQNFERERWEKAMSHAHSSFQKKVNYYKKMMGILMAKLSKRKHAARLHHNIQEMFKAELGKERFVKIMTQAHEVTEYERSLRHWNLAPSKLDDTTCICGHDMKDHKDIAGFSPPTHACEICTWEKCDDFMSKNDLRKIMKEC